MSLNYYMMGWSTDAYIFTRCFGTSEQRHTSQQRGLQLNPGSTRPCKLTIANTEHLQEAIHSTPLQSLRSVRQGLLPISSKTKWQIDLELTIKKILNKQCVGIVAAR